MPEKTLHWEHPLAKDYLDRGGSKAGAYAFLAETQDGRFDQNLPTGTHYLPPGGDPEEMLARLDPNTKKIVRACHPLDFTGMVDVIYTDSHALTTPNQIRGAIQRVLVDSRRDAVASYVEYESGAPFDNGVGIFVQDFMDHLEFGTQRGSIVEHPHKKGMYRICEGEDEYTAQSDARPPDLSVTQLYRRVQESGLVPSTHSFQMEWVRNRNTLWFLQARLFKPFEPPGDFDVNECSFGGEAIVTRQFDVFGLTGPEGTEPMHRADLTVGYDGNPKTACKFVALRAGERAVAYAHNGFDSGHSLPLEIMPRNMTAYLPYHPNALLGHGSFRWVQKASVTLGGLGAYGPASPSARYERRCSHQALNKDILVKVISNGITGAMCFVK